jgi:hypothetical protein
MRENLTIILSGMISADPHQGGASWHVLQYALGLRALGHRVLLLEPLDRARLQPAGAALGDSVNAGWFRQVVSQFGLDEWASLLLAGSRSTVGLSYARLCDIAGQADLLINISGMLADENLVQKIPVRAYLDVDPAFIQLWHAQGIDMRFAGHTHFVTIGQAIGQSGCPVPTCGLSWITTPQPMVLAHWPVATRIVHDGLTTVGNWRGYGSVEYEGVFYGQKAHSLRQYITLPRLTAERFLPALSIHPGEADDLAALAENGWQVLDPARVAGTPAAYRQFIQESKAEFGIAKSGYVASRCGWFSDRSICYLASGRPVIAQETGFSQFLPTGAGLFAFSNSEEALAAIDEMNRDYAYHSRSARGIAEEHFASDKVLSRLLRMLGMTS